jgi:hypothetical protein
MKMNVKKVRLDRLLETSKLSFKDFFFKILQQFLGSFKIIRKFKKHSR